MTDQPLPMFDDPPADTPTPPKKPKPKPTRKRRKRKAVALKPPKSDKIKRRKRRATKVKPVEQHHGGKFTDEVYRMIGTLMGMKGSERDLVVDIVKGLTNGRAS